MTRAKPLRRAPSMVRLPDGRALLEGVAAFGHRVDVRLPIVTEPDGARYSPAYPACADCGDAVLWAEAGGVPGTRRCDDCGSMYCDTRYGVGSPLPGGEG